MLTESIAALHSALDELLAVDLVGVDSAELASAIQGFETFKRRLPVADHRFVAEVDDRHLACGTVRQTSTSVFLQHLLRLTPGEAAGWVRAAKNLGPRTHRCWAKYSRRCSMRRGRASRRADLSAHARVIVDIVDPIPFALQADYEAQVEAQLVEFATLG